MSAAETAKALGISVRTLYNWRGMRRGPRPYSQGAKGSEVRYRDADVAAVIAAVARGWGIPTFDPDAAPEPLRLELVAPVRKTRGRSVKRPAGWKE